MTIETSLHRYDDPLQLSSEYSLSSRSALDLVRNGMQDHHIPYSTVLRVLEIDSKSYDLKVDLLERLGSSYVF